MRIARSIFGFEANRGRLNRRCLIVAMLDGSDLNFDVSLNSGSVQLSRMAGCRYRNGLQQCFRS